MYRAAVKEPRLRTTAGSSSQRYGSLVPVGGRRSRPWNAGVTGPRALDQPVHGIPRRSESVGALFYIDQDALRNYAADWQSRRYTVESRRASRFFAFRNLIEHNRRSILAKSLEANLQILLRVGQYLPGPGSNSKSACRKSESNPKASRIPRACMVTKLRQSVRLQLLSGRPRRVAQDAPNRSGFVQTICTLSLPVTMSRKFPTRHGTVLPQVRHGLVQHVVCSHQATMDPTNEFLLERARLPMEPVPLVQQCDPRTGFDEYRRDRRESCLSWSRDPQLVLPFSRMSGKAWNTGSCGLTRSGKRWARSASRATSFIDLPSTAAPCLNS